MINCRTADESSLPTVRTWHAHFRATGPGVLPPLPTTALHGALARALSEEVCLAPARPTCRGCPAERGCAYPRLFEPTISVPTELQKAIGITDEAPRPLVLAPEPPLVPTGVDRHRVAAGDRIAFRIGLADAAADTFPILVRSVRRAGRKGLGSSGSRMRLELERLCPVGDPQPDSPPERATLQLLTPLRVKVNGRIQPSLNAAALVAALVRRATLLATIEGPPWQPTFQPEQVAAGLEVTSSLSIVAVSRYSSRQRRSMTWPGLIGRLQLSGPGLTELWPLLRFGERVQIGKATSFGFGSYRLIRGAEQ